MRKEKHVVYSLPFLGGIVGLCRLFYSLHPYNEVSHRHSIINSEVFLKNPSIIHEGLTMKPIHFAELPGTHPESRDEYEGGPSILLFL